MTNGSTDACLCLPDEFTTKRFPALMALKVPEFAYVLHNYISINGTYITGKALLTGQE